MRVEQFRFKVSGIVWRFGVFGLGHMGFGCRTCFCRVWCLGRRCAIRASRFWGVGQG